MKTRNFKTWALIALLLTGVIGIPMVFAVYNSPWVRTQALYLNDVLVTSTAAELNAVDGLTGDVITTTSTSTLTNKTLTSPVLNTGVSGTAILDEDNMASDSATQLATQQSIKAYVNSGGAIANNVIKTGTLADNQVTVSTADGVVESTSGLTYDGSTFHVTGVIDMTGSTVIRGTGTTTGFGTNVLSDNVGTNVSGFGNSTLRYNTGDNASGIGLSALQYNTGVNASGVGYTSLRYNEGESNSAVGLNAFNTFSLDSGNAETFTTALAGNQITVTGHSFGADGAYRNLSVSTAGTLPTGLTTGVHQWELIDLNTLECRDGTFTAATGTGTHTLTPQYIYMNSTAVGYNAEPTASNQVQLGDNSVTTVSTYADLTFQRATFNGLVVTADQTGEEHTFNIPNIATSASDTFAFLAEAQTLTNKTLTSPVLDTGVSGTAILDEDNMASDSATQLATQQSIKAYVDSGRHVLVQGEIVDVSSAASSWTVSPVAGDIIGAYIVIDGAVSGSDASITFEIAAAATTGGVITIAASAAGSTYTATAFTGNNTVTAGQSIEILTDGGSTDAAKGTVVLVIEGVPSTPLRYIQGEIADISAGVVSTWTVAPIAGTITNIWTVIDGAIADVDAIITLEIAATPITGGAITVAFSGSAPGDVDTTTPSAANTVTAGQAIEIITNGASTNAVKVEVLIEITP